MSRFKHLLAAILLLSVSITVAVAQSEETLQRHTMALENLQLSVRHIGTDNTASLDALESAASTMRLVARDTASTSLVQAMESAFDNARTAIANQSRTDLTVQTAVLRGSFQRALLESSLQTGTVETARPGFNQLASELGLDMATLDLISQAETPGALLSAYQAGLARNMAARMQTMQAQFPDSQESAYITLAGTYGMSLSLQDAPQTPASLNSDFAELIQAVVNSEAEQVTEQSTALAEVLAGLGTQEPQQEPPAADAGPAAEPAAPEPVQEPAAEAEPPAVVPEPAAPGPEPAAEQPAEPAPAPAPAEAEPAQVTEPAETAEVAGATDEEAAEAADSTPAPDLEAVREQFEAEQQELAIAGLINDLGRRGIRGQAGETLAADLHSQGYASIAQAAGASLELSSRAASAAFDGNQAAARQHLTQLAGQYQNGLQPFLSRTDQNLNRSILDLLAGLQNSPSLRVADIQALTGLLVGAGSTAAGSTGTAAPAQAMSASWTSGWPRMALLIITALLAILPLTFLHMAFGGGNRNWSLIGSGLFLLLLPVILAGLAAVADLVGHLAAIPVLQQAAAWINLEGSLQQTLLILVILVAIILLAVGLFGICKQFGLFGGTDSGSAGTRKRDTGKNETRTLVDWDEEF